MAAIMKFCVTHVWRGDDYRISPWFDTSEEQANWISMLDIWTTRQGGYITCNYRAMEGPKMPKFSESGYYVLHGMLARAGGGHTLLAGPFRTGTHALMAKEWTTAQAVRAGLPISGDGYLRLSVEVRPVLELPRGRFTPAGDIFNRPVDLPGLM